MTRLKQIWVFFMVFGIGVLAGELVARPNPTKKEVVTEVRAVPDTTELDACYKAVGDSVIVINKQVAIINHFIKVLWRGTPEEVLEIRKIMPEPEPLEEIKSGGTLKAPALLESY